MDEERGTKLMQHIHMLENVMHFWNSASGMGQTVNQDHVMGVLAEILTRIDELREAKADLEARLLRCEERIADLVRNGIDLDKRVGDIDHHTVSMQLVLAEMLTSGVAKQ